MFRYTIRVSCRHATSWTASHLQLRRRQQQVLSSSRFSPRRPKSGAARRITIILSINLKTKTQSSRRHQSSLFHLFCSFFDPLLSEQSILLFMTLNSNFSISGGKSAQVLCCTIHRWIIVNSILKISFLGFP